jgi:hypothetical protein
MYVKKLKKGSYEVTALCYEYPEKRYLFKYITLQKGPLPLGLVRLYIKSVA